MTSSFSLFSFPNGGVPATKTVNHHPRGRNNARATSSTSSSFSGGCASCSSSSCSSSSSMRMVSMTKASSSSSSSSTTSKSVLRRSSFRVRASTVEGENEEEQVKSDGNNNNFNGGDDQFKRAPGEDQEKFQKSVADSPFSRKRIQPLPSKFGVSDRAAGAKQNLPFNQTTNRAGKDAPTTSSSSSSA